MDIAGKRGDGANMSFAGEFNYLGESPLEKFALNMGAVPLNNIKLSDSPLLPNEVEKGLGTINSELIAG